MTNITTVVKSIIDHQELVIGPLARDQAKKVAGIKVGEDGKLIVKGSAKEILSSLTKEYAKLFGQASVEVCKDAIRELSPPVSSDELPEILK